MTTGFPDPKQQPTMTVTEAAGWLGMSRASAYAAVQRGEIPNIRIGSRILIPTAPLRDLLVLAEPEEPPKRIDVERVARAHPELDDLARVLVDLAFKALADTP